MKTQSINIVLPSSQQPPYDKLGWLAQGQPVSFCVQRVDSDLGLLDPNLILLTITLQFIKLILINC